MNELASILGPGSASMLQGITSTFTNVFNAITGNKRANEAQNAEIALANKNALVSQNINLLQSQQQQSEAVQAATTSDTDVKNQILTSAIADRIVNQNQATSQSDNTLMMVLLGAAGVLTVSVLIFNMQNKK